MIRNVHERVINAPIEALGALLDGLGQKDDRLWPSQSWTPMVLDRPLAVGADGGHGVIRYYVSELRARPASAVHLPSANRDHRCPRAEP